MTNQQKILKQGISGAYRPQNLNGNKKCFTWEISLCKILILGKEMKNKLPMCYL